jgi:hypothetical protein
MKRLRLSFVCFSTLLALLFSLASCVVYDGDRRVFVERYWLYGHVFDGRGRPLRGISIVVRVINISPRGGPPVFIHKRTDSRGYFSFPLKGAQKGNVYINRSVKNKGKGRLKGAPAEDPFYSAPSLVFRTPSGKTGDKQGDKVFVRVEKSGAPSRYLASGERVPLSLEFTKMWREYNKIEGLYKAGRYNKAIEEGQKYIKKYSGREKSRAGKVENYVKKAKGRNKGRKYVPTPKEMKDKHGTDKKGVKEGKGKPTEESVGGVLGERGKKKGAEGEKPSGKAVKKDVKGKKKGQEEAPAPKELKDKRVVDKKGVKKDKDEEESTEETSRGVAGGKGK